jgi:stromal membrane-associated protein
MESFLRAVGIAAEQPAQESPLPLAPQEMALLPDIAKIAAETERGILALEEEAKSLERLPLPEALSLVKRWSQGLRKKPRPDDSLASFKAQFLRSNALEKALEGLRRNEPLRAALLDPPLFGSHEEALLTELRVIVQLCLPRAAASLVSPALHTVLTELAEGPATLAVVRVLKEDWTEVVSCQTLRALERRLDSLAYELQKSALAMHTRECRASPSPSREATSARRTSHEHVTVLALICEALEQSHSRHESHASEISSALASMGVDPNCFVAGGATSSRATAPRAADKAGTLGGTDTTSNDGLNGGTGGAGPNGLPCIQDCEAAVNAMVCKTEQGMQDGLTLLGLPGSPLHFVPGLELRLCGHDVRVAVNAMIAHWLQDERDEFFDVLRRIRQIVERPAMEPQEGELLQQRAALASERQALLGRLRSLEQQLSEVDARLARMSAGGESRSRAPSFQEAVQFLPGAVHGPTPHGRSTPLRETPPQRLSPLRPVGGSGEDFTALIGIAAEALATETQRTLERFASQLQQRRTQLLAGLSSHLEGQQERLLVLAVQARPPPSGTAMAAQNGSVGADFEAALQEARQLCNHVEAVTLGQSGCRLAGDGLVCGTRCRAKWMDGKYYDATVHQSNCDGTVVVNWLRPRPAGAGDVSPTSPLITVWEHGGDDTLHRTVMKADIHVDDQDKGDQSELQAALQLFKSRVAEDRLCADCGAIGADWASVSFGVYLCRACAEEHESLGTRVSLVRQLNDGWGWVQRELRYMARGGNGAFRTSLERYPAVQSLPRAERYSSRFAEYYRRHLDAICTGAMQPQPLSPDVAAQPSTKGEFLSAAEAAALAQEVSRRFETAVQQWASAQGRSIPSWRTLDAAAQGPRSHAGSRTQRIAC